MKLKINESLKKATAYMLRNDGKLFELSGAHPTLTSDLYYNIADLNYFVYALDWFYDNTNNTYLRDQIKDLIVEIVTNDYLDIDEKDRADIENYFMGKIDYSDSAHLDDIEDAFIDIYTAAYSEFCFVRTSDLQYGGSSKDIYFRIACHNGFNWFNLIWHMVNDNKSFIDTVTIVHDDDFEDFYKLDNKHVFNHMPTEEFLTLSGNPIIESFKN